MKGIENIALKKLNHFRSYVTRSTYIGISRVYGNTLHILTQIIIKDESRAKSLIDNIGQCDYSRFP